MTIAILSHKDVASWHAAKLMEAGHEIVISGGGAVHAFAVKGYLKCDECLLLGSEADLLEIADYFEASGKPIWRQLTDVPIGE